MRTFLFCFSNSDFFSRQKNLFKMGDEYDENEFEEDFGDADEPGNVDVDVVHLRGQKLVFIFLWIYVIQ